MKLNRVDVKSRSFDVLQILWERLPTYPVEFKPGQTEAYPRDNIKWKPSHSFMVDSENCCRS